MSSEAYVLCVAISVSWMMFSLERGVCDFVHFREPLGENRVLVVMPWVLCVCVGRAAFLKGVVTLAASAVCAVQPLQQQSLLTFLAIELHCPHIFQFVMDIYRGSTQ